MKAYELNDVYDISDIYKGVVAAIEAEECTAESMDEALDAIEEDFNTKVDTVVCLIKNKQALAASIKNEEKALAERRKRLEERTEFLKACLGEELLKNGKKKLETPRNKLSFRSSTIVLIDDELALKALHPELTSIKTVVTPDKNAIKAELKKGACINGAHLVERQNLQIK